MKVYFLIAVLLLTACQQVGIVGQVPPAPIIIEVVITATPQPTQIPGEKPLRFTAQYSQGNGNQPTGFSLPPYGTLCSDVEVKGHPADDAKTLYTIKAGETVRLREQPKTEPRDWVMIKPAEWIPLSAVCE